jgi:integrase
VSRLAAAAEEYLALRRSLGFKLLAAGRLLADFVAYATAAGLDTVTIEAALQWATQPAGTSPAWHAQRLGIVREFAKYLHALDPACQVPPADLLPYRPRRARPYLYCEEDITALMAQARRLTPRLRAATYEALVGLLAVSGMRPGEAIRLDRADVDLGVGVVKVVASKFGKSREVPLHPSTVTALAGYARLRDELSPQPQAASFLVSAAGTRLVHRTVDATFARLVHRVGLRPPPQSSRPRPRLHDLRHSLAVRALIGWYRSGADVPALLPSLSAYLGHVNPAATYWYLSAAPELLALASRRLQHRQAPR